MVQLIIVFTTKMNIIVTKVPLTTVYEKSSLKYMNHLLQSSTNDTSIWFRSSVRTCQDATWCATTCVIRFDAVH